MSTYIWALCCEMRLKTAGEIWELLEVAALPGGRYDRVRRNCRKGRRIPGHMQLAGASVNCNSAPAPVLRTEGLNRFTSAVFSGSNSWREKTSKIRPELTCLLTPPLPL